MVSVIVPIYKVEKYLRTCIDSIVNQTFSDLEIILVDDGSPDGCGAICDEYAGKDKRIQVVHKENGGLSDARNVGIDICSGDYIVFVDSDDCIHPQMIEHLYRLLDAHRADMAICSFQNIEEDETPLYPQNITLDNVNCFEKEDIMEQLQKRNLYTVVAWNKIYKTQLFQNIRYPKGYIHEDEFVIHRLLHLCNKTVYTDARLYYYRKRNDSIMGNRNLKEIQDAFEAYEDRISFLREQQYGEILVETQLQDMYQVIKYYKLTENKKEAKELTGFMRRKFAEFYEKKEIQDVLPLQLKKEYGMFYRSPSRYYAYMERCKRYDDLKEQIKKPLRRIKAYLT